MPDDVVTHELVMRTVSAHSGDVPHVLDSKGVLRRATAAEIQWWAALQELKARHEEPQRKAKR